MKGIIKKRNVLLIFFCYTILISVSFARPMTMKSIMDDGIIKKDFQLCGWKMKNSVIRSGSKYGF